MFPLSVTQYVKLGLCVILLCWAGYLGYALEAARFDRYKADQAAQTQKLQEEYQQKADQIEKDKNVQIRNINNQLLDAIGELRKRPSRASETGTGSCGTGATLFAEDAIFLRREAARADEIRAGLDACYKQYDSLK